MIPYLIPYYIVNKTCVKVTEWGGLFGLIVMVSNGAAITCLLLLVGLNNIYNILGYANCSYYRLIQNNIIIP